MSKQRPHLAESIGVNCGPMGGGSVAEVLKSPVIWPGGKSAIADRVWARFGNVDNFVEPFLGSAAVMLRRPDWHFSGGSIRRETGNDKNHYVVNFWRAVTADPDAVAAFADAPVTEADLHARHKWLVRSETAAAWRKRMSDEPDAYDAKIAGWWVWGLACWIGSGWCVDGKEMGRQIPEIGGGNYGASQRGVVQPYGVGSRRPVVNEDGRGYGVARGPGGRPQLADAFDLGRGVNASGGGLSGKRPYLTGAYSIGDGVCAPHGRCAGHRAWLVDWMRRLSDRLRYVRTCYGHWSRICDSDSTLTRLGETGVFLDPPYPIRRADNGKASRAKGLYTTDGDDLDQLRDEVLAWCRKWGQDKSIKVALCCYEGDGYEPLRDEGWTVEEWEAQGGYSNQGKKGKSKSDNAKRERIYWSPHCTQQKGLFE